LGYTFGVSEPRKASQTALLIAAYRARASLKENAIFRDPWAAGLAGSEGAALAEALDRVYPAMELWVAVRTAYLDAHVRRSEATQVVLLGAGLDTRAARLSKRGVRFFEVDHPSSQTDKKQRIARLPTYPMQAATHVACDFEMDDFLSILIDAGFRADEPALILWEGVTPYLHESAVRATLRAIAARCHPRSIVIFDHLLKKAAIRDHALEKNDAHAFVDRLGERVLWGTNDPVPLLYEEGFRHVRSLSFDEACLSFTGTYAREREFRFQRIVLASRTPPETI
jgi:methyltransferase (TIGR00027 family)